MNGKYFADTQGAAAKLRADVGANNVKIYDINNYSERVKVSVHTSDAMAKFSHVAVAVSGDPSSGNDWMVVAPYRVDHTKQGDKKCWDVDPILFVLDSDSGTSHASGVVAYHQKFAGRTTDVPAKYQGGSIDQTVQNLRAALTSDLQPLDKAPSEVLEAMSHMVKTFGAEFQ